MITEGTVINIIIIIKIITTIVAVAVHGHIETHKFTNYNTLTLLIDHRWRATDDSPPAAADNTTGRCR